MATSISIPRVLFADVVIPTGSVVTTAFTIATLTGGFRVTEASAYVPGSLGTSVTFNLGDTGGTSGSPGAVTTVAASATRYISGGTGSAAGKVIMADTLAGGVGFTTPNSGTSLVLAVAGATTTAPQTITIKLVLAEAY